MFIEDFHTAFDSYKFEGSSFSTDNKFLGTIEKTCGWRDEFMIMLFTDFYIFVHHEVIPSTNEVIHRRTTKVQSHVDKQGVMIYLYEFADDNPHLHSQGLEFAS